MSTWQQAPQHITVTNDPHDHKAGTREDDGDEFTAHTIIDLIQKKQNKEVLVSMRVVYRLWVDNMAPLYETLTKTLYMRLSF